MVTQNWALLQDWLLQHFLDCGIAIPHPYCRPVHSVDCATAPGLEGEAKIPGHRGGGAGLKVVPTSLRALRSTTRCSGVRSGPLPLHVYPLVSEAVLKHPRYVFHPQTWFTVLSCSPHTPLLVGPGGFQTLVNRDLVLGCKTAVADSCLYDRIIHGLQYCQIETSYGSVGPT